MKSYTVERTIIERVAVLADDKQDARQEVAAGRGEVISRTVLNGVWVEEERDVEP